MEDKKTVFISGGSRGIGSACVRKFQSMGWNVVFTYNNSRDKADSLAEELGDSVLAIKMNLGDIEDIKSALNQGRTFFGVSAYDCLVANAGISKSGTLTSMDYGDIDEIIEIDLKSQIYLVKEGVSPMIREKKGAIVLISSMWGVRGASCESIYAASKAGLIGFGKSLALELAPSGIRVNMVSPGIIDTDMNSGYSHEERRKLESDTPAGRWGSPEEVAEGVYFLASQEASFITGQVITIDGGITV